MFYLVLGAGISGIGACNLLIKKNQKVILYDKDKFKLYSIYNAKLVDKSIVLCTKLNKIKLHSIKRIVVSPGVKISKTMHKKAKLYNIDIISEIELGAQYNNGELIAITGTNGKTTTTLLATHILNCVQKKAVAVGNVGCSISEVILSSTKDNFLVCEASSFQLQYIKQFKPKISAFLNFAPDHLDVHSTINEYFICKQNIYKNQDKQDYVILNYDDRTVFNCAKNIKANVVYFSIKHSLGNYKYSAYKSKDFLYIKLDKKLYKLQINTKMLSINLYNVLVASTIALLYGVDILNVKESINSFKLPPHRCEFVINKNGVDYINDSKATNIHATLNALSSFKKPIILLLGGSNKGEDFSYLFKNLTPNVKYIMAFGKMGKKIFNLSKKFKIKAEFIYNFEDAVKKSMQIAKSGDVVLLSPACASFDQFTNYLQRGDFFKYLVSGENFESIK